MKYKHFRGTCSVQQSQQGSAQAASLAPTPSWSLPPAGMLTACSYLLALFSCKLQHSRGFKLYGWWQVEKFQVIWGQVKKEPKCRMVNLFFFLGGGWHKILAQCMHSKLSYTSLVSITQWISSLASEGHNICWNMGVLQEMSVSLWKAEETNISQYLRLLQQSLL